MQTKTLVGLVVLLATSVGCERSSTDLLQKRQNAANAVARDTALSTDQTIQKIGDACAMLPVKATTPLVAGGKAAAVLYSEAMGLASVKTVAEQRVVYVEQAVADALCVHRAAKLRGLALYTVSVEKWLPVQQTPKKHKTVLVIRLDGAVLAGQELGSATADVARRWVPKATIVEEHFDGLEVRTYTR